MNCPITNADIQAVEDILDLVNVLKDLRSNFVQRHTECGQNCLEDIPSEVDISRKLAGITALKQIIILKHANDDLPVTTRFLREKLLSYLNDMESFKDTILAVTIVHQIALVRVNFFLFLKVRSCYELYCIV